MNHLGSLAIVSLCWLVLETGAIGDELVERSTRLARELGDATRTGGSPKDTEKTIRLGRELIHLCVSAPPESATEIASETIKALEPGLYSVQPGFREVLPKGVPGALVCIGFLVPQLREIVGVEIVKCWERTSPQTRSDVIRALTLGVCDYASALRVVPLTLRNDVAEDPDNEALGMLLEVQYPMWDTPMGLYINCLRLSLLSDRAMCAAEGRKDVMAELRSALVQRKQAAELACYAGLCTATGIGADWGSLGSLCQIATPDDSRARLRAETLCSIRWHKTDPLLRSSFAEWQKDLGLPKQSELVAMLEFADGRSVDAASLLKRSPSGDLIAWLLPGNERVADEFLLRLCDPKDESNRLDVAIGTLFHHHPGAFRFPLQNLRACVARCELDVRMYVALRSADAEVLRKVTPDARRWIHDEDLLDRALPAGVLILTEDAEDRELGLKCLEEMSREPRARIWLVDVLAAAAHLGREEVSILRRTWLEGDQSLFFCQTAGTILALQRARSRADNAASVLAEMGESSALVRQHLQHWAAIERDWPRPDAWPSAIR